MVEDFLRSECKVLPTLGSATGVWEPTRFASYFCALITKFAPRQSQFLDIGAGSGILAIYAATNHHCRAFALDISYRATRIAATNGHLKNVPIHAINCDALAFLRHSRNRFGCIVANTPSFPDGFYRSARDSYYFTKGNGRGSRLLVTVLSEGRRALLPGGVLITCVHAEQNIDYCVRLARHRFRRVLLHTAFTLVSPQPVFQHMKFRNLARGLWNKGPTGEIYTKTVFIIASP